VAPYFLINVEMDDHGVIGEAGCDCTYSKIGLQQTIHGIHSYGKLTGQGMTLTGTDVVRLLEEKMPALFGGSPGDYQPVEYEGAGQTQLMLRVSARSLHLEGSVAGSLPS